MKRGDKIIVTVAGRSVECVITLASANGRSLAASFDEGVPLPFALDRTTGLQSLLLFQDDDGTWHDIMGNRPVTIKPVASTHAEAN